MIYQNDFVVGGLEKIKIHGAWFGSTVSVVFKSAGFKMVITKSKLV